MNKVIVGDCVKEMKKLEPGSVDLVFADPPFNIGMKYDEYKDSKSRSEYLRWTSEWLQAAVATLKPHGSLFIASGDEFVAELKVRADELGLHLRNWIVWHYTFGVACTKKFNRSHTHLLYFAVDRKNFTFNTKEVAVPSARQTVYADKRANSTGKTPDDTWVLRPQEADWAFSGNDDTWYYPRLCGTFRERQNHPCQMPESVLDRIIRVASNPGDLVLDPFAGSGTTLAVAKKQGRRFIGIELSKGYVKQIRDRLAKIKS